MFAKVSDLPVSLRNALAALHYTRSDIEISARERTSIQVGGGDGKRGFACLVDMAAGTHTVSWGSWGGANAFNPRNAVDCDSTEYDIPTHGAVISGTTGGGRPVYATITVHPASLAPLLPAAPAVTAIEAKVLAIYAQLKSSARGEYLAQIPDAGVIVDSLVSRGFLDRNKAGATKITTTGRNSAARSYY